MKNEERDRDFSFANKFIYCESISTLKNLCLLQVRPKNYKKTISFKDTTSVHLFIFLVDLF